MASLLRESGSLPETPHPEVGTGQHTCTSGSQETLRPKDVGDTTDDGNCIPGLYRRERDSERRKMSMSEGLRGHILKWR